ncbi:MAG: protein kinase [Lysinibacillus sp.]
MEMERDIHCILKNLDEILTDENFVGIGSTRKAYRYKQFVIKEYLHEIGYLQTKNEATCHKTLQARRVADHVAPILYFDEEVMIQPYFEQLPLINHCSYDLNLQEDSRLTADLQEALSIIDKELNGFDFRDSGNYGLDGEGNLVLIDYGMTKKLYERKWVPLAEAGVLPQISFEQCQSCGMEKEIRTYGKEDADRRCVACGKE